MLLRCPSEIDGQVEFEAVAEAEALRHRSSANQCSRLLAGAARMLVLDVDAFSDVECCGDQGAHTSGAEVAGQATIYDAVRCSDFNVELYWRALFSAAVGRNVPCNFLADG